MAQKIEVTEELRGKRADVAATGAMPELSRAYVHKLFESGRITLDGESIKPGHKLRLGERLIIDFDPSELGQIPDIELPILYEDDDVLVIDKPAGVISHARGRFWNEASVASFVRQKTGQPGERSGIVHRLDRVTSGVMICAKNAATLSALQKQFSQRGVQKTYMAIVRGHLKPQEAIIDMPIGRNLLKPQTFHATPHGKAARTRYKVLESAGSYDLVQLQPETGRTHQLRVHLHEVGHPIIGDHLYIGEGGDRLYLHATTLEVTLPSGERKQFESPLPKDSRRSWRNTVDEVALHPVCQEQLQAFLAAPSHALCLIGPPGAGKGFLATALAGELLGKTTDDAIQHLGQDKAIGIEDIRSLQQFLRLKKPGAATIRRVVILEQAQNMGDEAQNALLKTLEEPPADTVFILTTDGSAGLKPTIYSRTQAIRLLPLGLEQAQTLFAGQDISKAFHLSGGYAGLLHALLHDSDHHLVAAVEQAKSIIGASYYERLLMIDGLSKQKDELPTLLYALQRVLGAILSKTKDTAKLRRLATSLRAIYHAQLDLDRNANPKLLLSDLFLHL